MHVLCVRPTGGVVCVGCADQTAKVIRIYTIEPERETRGNSSSSSRSDTGAGAASAQGGSSKASSTASSLHDRLLIQPATLLDLGGHCDEVKHVAFSPSSTALMTGCMGRPQVRIYRWGRGFSSSQYLQINVRDGEDPLSVSISQSVGRGTDQFTLDSCDWTPDSTKVVTAHVQPVYTLRQTTAHHNHNGWRQRIKLWCASTGTLLRVFVGHRSSVRAVKHSITCSSHRIPVRICMRPVHTVEWGYGHITHTLVCSTLSTLRWRRIGTGDVCVISFSLRCDGDLCYAVLIQVYKITFNPVDPRVMLTTGYDGRACLWDTETGEHLASHQIGAPRVAGEDSVEPRNGVLPCRQAPTPLDASWFNPRASASIKLSSKAAREEVDASGIHQGQVSVGIEQTPSGVFIRNDVVLDTVESDRDPSCLLTAQFVAGGEAFCVTDTDGRMVWFASPRRIPQYLATPHEQYFSNDYQPLMFDSHARVIDANTQSAPHRIIQFETLCDGSGVTLVPLTTPQPHVYPHKGVRDPEVHDAVDAYKIRLWEAVWDYHGIADHSVGLSRKQIMRSAMHLQATEAGWALTATGEAVNSGSASAEGTTGYEPHTLANRGRVRAAHTGKGAIVLSAHSPPAWSPKVFAFVQENRHELSTVLVTDCTTNSTLFRKNTTPVFGYPSLLTDGQGSTGAGAAAATFNARGQAPARSRARPQPQLDLAESSSDEAEAAEATPTVWGRQRAIVSGIEIDDDEEDEDFHLGDVVDQLPGRRGRRNPTRNAEAAERYRRILDSSDSDAEQAAVAQPTSRELRRRQRRQRRNQWFAPSPRRRLTRASTRQRGQRLGAGFDDDDNADEVDVAMAAGWGSGDSEPSVDGRPGWTQDVVLSDDDIEDDDEDGGSEPNEQPAARPARRRVSGNVAAQLRSIADRTWLAQSAWADSVYVPQVGDDVVYMVEGHRQYLRETVVPHSIEVAWTAPTGRPGIKREEVSTEPWHAWGGTGVYVHARVVQVQHGFVPGADLALHEQTRVQLSQRELLSFPVAMKLTLQVQATATVQPTVGNSSASASGDASTAAAASSPFELRWDSVNDGTASSAAATGSRSSSPVQFELVFRPTDQPDFILLKSRFDKLMHHPWSVGQLCAVPYQVGDTKDWLDGSITVPERQAYPCTFTPLTDASQWPNLDTVPRVQVQHFVGRIVAIEPKLIPVPAPSAEDGAETVNGADSTGAVAIAEAGRPANSVDASGQLYSAWRSIRVVFVADLAAENEEGGEQTASAGGAETTSAVDDTSLTTKVSSLGPWELLPLDVLPHFQGEQGHKALQELPLEPLPVDHVVSQQLSEYSRWCDFAQHRPVATSVSPLRQYGVMPPAWTSLVQQILHHIQRSRPEWSLFMTPVPPNTPGYYALIACPIDISMIYRRVCRRFYRRLDGLRADLSLLASNCQLYNEVGCSISQEVERMVGMLMDRCKAMEDGADPHTILADARVLGDSDHSGSDENMGNDAPVGGSDSREGPSDQRPRTRRNGQAEDQSIQRASNRRRNVRPMVEDSASDSELDHAPRHATHRRRNVGPVARARTRRLATAEARHAAASPQAAEATAPGIATRRQRMAIADAPTATSSRSPAAVAAVSTGETSSRPASASADAGSASAEPARRPLLMTGEQSAAEEAVLSVHMANVVETISALDELDIFAEEVPSEVEGYYDVIPRSEAVHLSLLRDKIASGAYKGRRAWSNFQVGSPELTSCRRYMRPQSSSPRHVTVSWQRYILCTPERLTIGQFLCRMHTC